MNEHLKKKSLTLLACLGIYASWWGILLGVANCWGRIATNYETYMMGYYLSVVVVMYVLYLLVIPYLTGVLRSQGSSYYQAIGLRLDQHSLWLTLGLVMATVVGFLIMRSPVFASEPGAWLYTVQPPLVEELLFRGIIPYLMLKHFDKKVAFVGSLLLFGSLHVMNGVLGVSISMIWGALFLLLTVQSKSILPAIVLHYVVNAYNLMAWVLCFGVIGIYEMVYIIKRRRGSKL